MALLCTSLQLVSFMQLCLPHFVRAVASGRQREGSNSTVYGCSRKGEKTHTTSTTSVSQHLPYIEFEAWCSQCFSKSMSTATEFLPVFLQHVLLESRVLHVLMSSADNLSGRLYMFLYHLLFRVFSQCKLWRKNCLFSRDTEAYWLHVQCSRCGLRGTSIYVSGVQFHCRYRILLVCGNVAEDNSRYYKDTHPCLDKWLCRRFIDLRPVCRWLLYQRAEHIFICGFNNVTEVYHSRSLQ